MHRGIEIISYTDRNKVLNIYGTQNLKPKSENLQIPGLPRNPSANFLGLNFKDPIPLQRRINWLHFTANFGFVMQFLLPFLTEDDFSKIFQKVTSCVCHSLNLK